MSNNENISSKDDSFNELNDLRKRILEIRVKVSLWELLRVGQEEEEEVRL